MSSNEENIEKLKKLGLLDEESAASQLSRLGKEVRQEKQTAKDKLNALIDKIKLSLG